MLEARDSKVGTIVAARARTIAVVNYGYRPCPHCTSLNHKEGWGGGGGGGGGRGQAPPSSATVRRTSVWLIRGAAKLLLLNYSYAD